MGSVFGTNNVWQLLSENKKLCRNTAKNFPHNGIELSNVTISTLYSLVIVNKYKFPLLSTVLFLSLLPFLLSVSLPLSSSAVQAALHPLSSLLAPLLAGSRSPFLNLAVSMHPSLGCFLSTCVHDLHFHSSLMPICLHSSPVYTPISLSLSSPSGELFDLDAASLQLKVINYVSSKDHSSTPSCRHTHICAVHTKHEILYSDLLPSSCHCLYHKLFIMHILHQSPYSIPPLTLCGGKKKEGSHGRGVKIDEEGERGDTRPQLPYESYKNSNVKTYSKMKKKQNGITVARREIHR